MNILAPARRRARLVHWQAERRPAVGVPRRSDQDAVGRANGNVRMALATPAVFAGGWRPGWIDATTLTAGPRRRAESQARRRLQPALESRLRMVAGRPSRPQADQPLAPAGSVYFFKTTDDRASLAAALAPAG